MFPKKARERSAPHSEGRGTGGTMALMGKWILGKI